MTARALNCVHPVEWRSWQWVYSDIGKPLSERHCAYCNRQQQKVRVKIPADLSCKGFAYYKYVDIDACIAPIVEALQQAGIDMRGSCCGHGKTDGSIRLQDGRILIIKQDGRISGKTIKSRGDEVG